MARKLQLFTDRLTCDVERRTISGVVLPFGKVGRTSLGKLTAAKDGGWTVADEVIGNMEHDRKRPVARMSASEVTDKGLRMTFAVAKTTAGDDLLAEVEAGLRTGLSIECADPVVRAGALVGGSIDAVGFVTHPAFDTARAELVAEDTGDAEPTDDELEADDENTDENTDEDTDDENADQEAPAVTASRKLGQAGSRRVGIKTVAEFAKRMSAAVMAGDHRMLAALADITQSGVGGDISTQQFLGELWDGAPYERRFVPLMAKGALTSYEVKGWRWTTKPEVADYTGDKADVPSNTPDTESSTVTAARLAGAHDLDRKFTDFGDSEFLAAYLTAMTESYKRKSDLKALAFLEASATATVGGAVPTGLSNAAAGIVDAALAVLSATDTPPDFAVVGTAMYRSLMLQTNDNLLALLSQSIGLKEGALAGFKLVPGGAAFPVGKVLAGVRKASRFLELPGSPIRVDALNISQGGTDTGLFGYYATMLDDAAGLAYLTVDPASISAGADFAMAVGDPNQAVTVIATYADGSTADVTADAVLTSGTTAKATIVSNKVHPVAAGTSVITATYNDHTDVATVTVS